MHIQRRVLIKSPPELVWDTITELSRAKEWTLEFNDYPFISPDWPKPGATAVWRYHAGPFQFDFHLSITESVRGKALQIANRSVFGSGIEVYSFTFSGGVTTVWYDASDKPNLLGKTFRPLLEKRLVRQIESTMADLKTYCERR
ncbi:MAG: SRPBCC family protein [Deltaproteobacteria bacterium]|nr:SRPBCC family protein [Deltaproteobacteria bacterium]